MFSLEDKLRPRPHPNAWARDLFVVGLLIALGAVLLPTLGIDMSAALARPDSPESVEVRNHQFDLIFRQVTEQMASVLLLMSLGFLLCLRVGAIDLSVWAAAGLGGLVAAWLINAGVSAGPAFAAAIAAGAAFGAVNGAIVAAAKLPAVAVTLVTGLLLVWALQGSCDARSVELPDDAFVDWHVVQTVTMLSPDSDTDAPQPPGRGVTESVTRPLYVTRSLLVAMIYAAVMLVLMGFGRSHAAESKPGARWRLLVAMTASGALAALGGALWLLDHNRAPVPTRLVDDLRVPTAAILAGALLLAGKGRALFAAVCLPGALLLTGIWRQRVWNIPAAGYLLQLPLLAAAVWIAHAALANLTAPSSSHGEAVPRRAHNRRLLPALTLTAAVAGILTLAAAANVHNPTARLTLHIAGPALSAIAAAMLVARRRRRPVARIP